MLVLYGCSTTGKTFGPPADIQKNIGCNEGETYANGKCLASASMNLKAFDITAADFKFVINGVESPELHVKEGDNVKVNLEIIQGYHDWGIDEFNARTESKSAAASTSVEFIADKKGTYEYYCSIGRHRQMGMKGNFIVE